MQLAATSFAWLLLIGRRRHVSDELFSYAAIWAVNRVDDSPHHHAIRQGISRGVDLSYGCRLSSALLAGGGHKAPERFWGGSWRRVTGVNIRSV